MFDELDELNKFFFQTFLLARRRTQLQIFANPFTQFCLTTKTHKRENHKPITTTTNRCCENDDESVTENSCCWFSLLVPLSSLSSWKGNDSGDWSYEKHDENQCKLHERIDVQIVYRSTQLDRLKFGIKLWWMNIFVTMCDGEHDDSLKRKKENKEQTR